MVVSSVGTNYKNGGRNFSGTVTKAAQPTPFRRCKGCPKPGASIKKLLLIDAAFTAVIVPAIAAEKPVSSLLLCAPAEPRAAHGGFLPMAAQ
jgi:hypothetical protein